jgi:hypothetical protein
MNREGASETKFLVATSGDGINNRHSQGTMGPSV